MELIGARLDGRTDDAAHEVTELGRRILGDLVEFLDGVHAGGIPNQVIGDLVVVHPVQHEVVGLLAVAVHIGAAAVAGSQPAGESGGVGVNRSRRQQRQLHVITRRERQRGIGARVDHLTQQGLLRLQYGSRRSHLHSGLHVAHLKLEIHLANLVHLQRDIGLRRRLEPGSSPLLRYTRPLGRF